MSHLENCCIQWLKWILKSSHRTFISTSLYRNNILTCVVVLVKLCLSLQTYFITIFILEFLIVLLSIAISNDYDNGTLLKFLIFAKWRQNEYTHSPHTYYVSNESKRILNISIWIKYTVHCTVYTRMSNLKNSYLESILKNKKSWI